MTSKGPEAQFGARETKEFHFRYSRNSALSEHAAFFETYNLVKKLTVLVISTAFMCDSCFNMFKLAFFKISLVEAMEIRSMKQTVNPHHCSSGCRTVPDTQ